MIIVMLCTRTELHFTMFLAIVPIIFLVVFSLGVGLALAALTVKFRDVIHLYGVFLTGLMYLTPIIYPMSILPNWVRFIVNLNPLTWMVEMFRDVMIYNTIPSFTKIVVSLVVSFVTLAIGLWIFYKQQDDFILNL